MLHERQHLLHTPHRTSPCHPSVRSVVLIKDDLPRGMWRLGQINQLHKGQDGQVRAATLSTDGKQLRRPLKLLYLLECVTDNSATAPALPDQPVAVDSSHSSTMSERPRRYAAERGRLHLQELIGKDSV